MSLHTTTRLSWKLILITLLLVSCTQTNPRSTPVLETRTAATISSESIPSSDGNTSSITEPPSPSQHLNTPQQTVKSVLLPAEQAVMAELEGAPRYHLAIDIDNTNRRFRGTSSVTYTNQEDTVLEQLYFRLYPNGGKSYGNGSLSVGSVQVDGRQIQTTLTLDDTILEIPLWSPLVPGEQTTIDFTFQGEIPGDDGVGYGIFSSRNGVTTLAGWFPILAVYDEKGWNLNPISIMGDSVFSDIAFFTVDLSTPKEQVVAATGILEIEQALEDKIIRRYTSGPVRDFALVMSPDFIITQRQVDDVTVNAYTLPGLEGIGEEVLDTGAGALKVFSHLFGAYPYSEFDIVEAPMHYALGVEFPGMALISSELYTSPDDHYFITTTSHEAAHQWWYNIVGNNVFNEPWLDEGLATYSSALYFEQEQGKEAFQQFINGLQTDYQTYKTSNDDLPVNSSLWTFEEPGIVEDYASVVYLKGALFLHELRERLGDQVFFDALHTYYQQYKYKIASGKDLLDIFESTAGRPLTEIYQQWLDLDMVEKNPQQAAAQAISFAVIGDYGSGNANARSVSELVKRWKPDFIITVGDNNYPSGSRETIDDNVGQFYTEYIAHYQGKYGPGADFNAFYPTPGNHDWDSERLQPYLDYFNLPGNEYYYDFRMGPVHFFALDTDSRTPDGVGLSSIQGQWLKEKLAGSDAPWKVVYGHVPPYSSGYNGSVEWIRWPFKEWGATIYLSGHDHDYERLEVDGFPYIVNGLGGGEIYYFLDPLPGSQARYVDGYGAMLVIASIDQITFQFQTVEGEVIDTFTIRK